MQNLSTSRAELMVSFQVLQQEFDRMKSDINTKENDFDKLRKDFAEQLNICSDKLIKGIGSDNPLQPLAYTLTEQFESTFERWERQVSSRAKGTKFRENLGDSLLVFIYGKVKSGKSSLGNYMAWGHSEPSSELKKQSTQPVYFSAEQTQVTGGDQAKEAEKTLHFRVNATEATSSIQGFKMPGLTWIDSPGLHSVNASNGHLAKEYVEHADLILYTMNSQAPGRASDMEEIKDLLNSNKKVMVLLTGSDTTDEDEDEKGNIITHTLMKDDSDQQEQREYVQGELKKLNNSSNILTDVLTISTRYAELNPSISGITKSGMGKLMHEMKLLCTEGQALSIKLNTPMENLKHSICITTNDLSGAGELITNFAASIEKQADDLQRELRSLGVQGSSQMRAYINQTFAEDQKSDLTIKLRNKASEIIEQLALEAFSKIGENQQQGFKKAFDSSSLSDLPEYQEITEEKEYFIGTRKSNKNLFALAGAAIGGTVGFFVGGPPGALIGASLGSSANMAGRSANAEYGRHQVVVGDNREEQRQSAIEHYSNTLPNLLIDHVNSLYSPHKVALFDYCNTLNKNIAELISTFGKLSEVNPS